MPGENFYSPPRILFVIKKITKKNNKWPRICEYLSSQYASIVMAQGGSLLRAKGLGFVVVDRLNAAIN